MIRIEFSAEFKKELRRLSRKYRHIRSDLQPILDDLAAGLTPGDQVAGIGAAVFKVRAANRDAQTGKSGGYRVIYYLQTDTLRVLLTMYSKSEPARVGKLHLPTPAPLIAWATHETALPNPTCAAPTHPASSPAT